MGGVLNGINNVIKKISDTYVINVPNTTRPNNCLCHDSNETGITGITYVTSPKTIG